MRHILVIFLSLFTSALIAQSAYIQDVLAKELISPEAQNRYYSVLLVLKAQTNLDLLISDFNKTQTPSIERAKRTLHELIKTSSLSQQLLTKKIESYLVQNPGCLKSIESYWIINSLLINARGDLLLYLQNLPEIESIFREDFITVSLIEPKWMKSSKEKSIGGSEAGLRAINAHKMWKLGYTGKGRLSYSVDTGVWTEHPTISDRFMGNFFPLSQCWLPFDSKLPADKSNSHGTHTLGTTLGLDKSTQDTIGVAFNSYWIASDPIVTDVSLIKPFTVIMTAFQWALNPDGDTSTVYDIPDAINNSWGRTATGDTSYCSNSIITQTFDAVEAAGIANVFSAGNSGPGAATISDPHQIAKSLVNTFTVGALNGNDTTFPIASFSSRGPTKCPVSANLSIKPEVSAPGVDVRSGVGKNGFALYSGTSMAAPHTTGAVLLLKEAFPFLPGDQLLLALYWSARDLGSLGEDNTYGMGKIDVFEAFTYLSTLYTPNPPVKNTWDVAIREIINPNIKLSCDTTFYPVISVQNRGDSTFTSFKVQYNFNNQAAKIFTWTGNLSPNQIDTLILPLISTGIPGDKELMFKIITDSSIVESDKTNNNRMVRFNIRGMATLPFFEDFEYTTFQSNTKWLVQNTDQLVTWDTAATGGLDWGRFSAAMKFSSYFPKNYQYDDLITPYFTTPAAGKLTLKFNYAYQHRHTVFSDSLKISLSDDCGESFKHVLFYKGGANLSTHDSVTIKFIPKYPHHWKDTSIDISQFSGGKKILIRFSGINSFGNNLYIDNVIVYAGSVEPVTVPETLEKITFSIFPNPGYSYVMVKSNQIISKMVKIEMIDIVGRLIKCQTFMFSSDTQSIDISDLVPGLYFIKINYEEETRILKLIKK